MISALNELISEIDADTGTPVDVAALASRHGSTEYHLRRMFASLAGMPVSEYVRRRRMSRAAADVLGTTDDLLTIAIRYGYGSAEAFGRAFRAVHGASPGEVRRDGGPVNNWQQLRFRLTVEGSTSMRVRIEEKNDVRLVGHATRVPLIYEGPNPHIGDFIAGLPQEEHARLKALSGADPRGLLQITDDAAQDAAEGTELTYMHGVSVSADADVPAGLDVIVAAAGRWAIFETEGPHPSALQDTWAATAAEWFPSNPWRLRPGPSIVAILERSDDFTWARCELWLPVESAEIVSMP
ncbi:AraC family transcriptional regulator [Microbacterium sp. G2-8]|uniref:AraC family transcriptional regulator n=1 Tax=Microbacterium sp. G2-8 TaxID=2842454 RepID=UPI001C896E0C|nr:AraC family transcriptional regulator [Microbacterium sp. G2-8]